MARRVWNSVAVVLATGYFGAAARAQSYQYTFIKVPGSTDTKAMFLMPRGRSPVLIPNPMERCVCSDMPMERA